MPDESVEIEGVAVVLPESHVGPFRYSSYTHIKEHKVKRIIEDYTTPGKTIQRIVVTSSELTKIHFRVEYDNGSMETDRHIWNK